MVAVGQFNLREDLSHMSGRVLIPGLLLVWDELPSCRASGFSYITLSSPVPSSGMVGFLFFCFFLTFYILIIIDEAIDFEDIFFAYTFILGFKNSIFID